MFAIEEAEYKLMVLKPQSFADIVSCLVLSEPAGDKHFSTDYESEYSFRGLKCVNVNNLFFNNQSR